VRPGLAAGEQRGIVVQAVSDGTSAADAGILAGDVMIAWNGQLLIGAGDLAARLREHKPGDVVKILVDRDGEELEIDVELKASEGGARRGN
jgi:putative serine protease PepD